VTGIAILVTGLAALAAGCAFAIVYGEWSRRFPPERARREGLRAGLVAFAVFEAVGVVVVVVAFR